MIYLLDDNFKLINMPLEGFESLIWHDKFFECGDFELHAPYSISYATYIYDNDYGYTGIIEGLQKKEQRHMYTGRLLKALLDKKVISERKNYYGKTAEYIAKDLVSTFAGQNIQVAPNQDRGSKIDTLQVTGDNLMNYTDSLLREANLSGRIELDFLTNTLTYEVYDAVDMTNKAPMSKEFENIYSTEYKSNTADYRNFAYVAGEEVEGKQRVIVTVDMRSSPEEEKRELWVDARDLQSNYEDEKGNKITLTATQYKQALTQRGKEKLAEKQIVEAIDIEPKDAYNIGEVRLYKDGGLITEQMITEKMVAYEEGRIKQSVIFGTQDII